MATELNSEDTFTLTEIGYASVMYGVGVDVNPIFDTLSLLYPDNTAGAIGHAILQISSGRYDDAINDLQQCLTQCSTNTEEAKAILLLAMHLSGRTEDAEALADAVDSREGVATEMAESLFTERHRTPETQ